MKTFNKSDLITWANCDKAIVGNKYYFAHTLIGMQRCIENSSYIETLEEIDENDISSPFIYHEEEYVCNFACILPVDAVKEIKPEKKYRACQTIKEFYEVINNYRTDSFPNNDFTDENFICNLLDTTIHIRTISTHTEYFFSIRCIRKYEQGGIEILMTLNKSYLSFEEIFENYEIELNGEWQPFGVLED